MTTPTMAAEQVTKMRADERICKHCGERIYSTDAETYAGALPVTGRRHEWLTVLVLSGDTSLCPANQPPGGAASLDDLGPHVPGGELDLADTITRGALAMLERNDVAGALDELDAAIKLYVGVYS